MTTGHVYYLRNDDDEIIYIGSTEHIERRLRHWRQKLGAEIAAVNVISHPNRDSMLAAESTAIRLHNPKHNRLSRTDLPDRVVNRWGVSVEHR